MFSRINITYIFHQRYEFSVLIRRDAPFLSTPEFKFVFFNVFRIVSRDTLFVSVWARVFHLSSNSRNVHRTLPSGFGSHPNATSLASSAPLRDLGRCPLFIPSRAGSNPFSTNRSRNCSSPRRDIPFRSAIISSVYPSSASSNACARFFFCALCLPLLITAARIFLSSSVKVTSYFFAGIVSLPYGSYAFRINYIIHYVNHVGILA